MKIQKITDARFKHWTKSFSMTVLMLITTYWAVDNAYILFLMTVQYFQQGLLSENVLIVFIEKINEVFLASVVAIAITRTFGNVFEFNNGALFGVSNNIGAPDYVNNTETQATQKEEDDYE